MNPIELAKKTWEKLDEGLRIRMETIAAMFVVTSDLVTDYILVVEWFLNGETLYPTLLLLFIFVPGLTMALVMTSLSWDKSSSLQTPPKWQIALCLTGFGRIVQGLKRIQSADDANSFYFLTKILDLALETFPSSALQTYILVTAKQPVSLTSYIVCGVSYFTLSFGAAKLYFTVTEIENIPYFEFFIRACFYLSDFLFRTIPLFLLYSMDKYVASINITYWFLFEFALSSGYYENGSPADLSYPPVHWVQHHTTYAIASMFYNNLELTAGGLGNHIALRNLEFSVRWLASVAISCTWSLENNNENTTILFVLISAGTISLVSLCYLRCFPIKVSCVHATWYNKKTLVQAALDDAYDVNHKAITSKGWTVLHIASFFGYMDLVNLFLNCAADVDPEDNDMRTPLMLAAMNGHYKVVESLLTVKADQDHVDKTLQTALHLAAKEGNIETVEVLVANKAVVDLEDSKGKTAFFLAAEEGHVGVMNSLLNAGADKYHTDKNGCTALSLAGNAGHKEVEPFLSSNTIV